jgi:hypothetical protein
VSKRYLLRWEMDLDPRRRPYPLHRCRLHFYPEGAQAPERSVDVLAYQPDLLYLRRKRAPEYGEDALLGWALSEVRRFLLAGKTIVPKFWPLVTDPSPLLPAEEVRTARERGYWTVELPDR